MSWEKLQWTSGAPLDSLTSPVYPAQDLVATRAGTYLFGLKCEQVVVLLVRLEGGNHVIARSISSTNDVVKIFTEILSVSGQLLFTSSNGELAGIQSRIL